MRVSTLAIIISAALGIQGSALPEPEDANTLVERYAITSEPTWVNLDKFKYYILKRHNQFRKAHGVGYLTWDDTLAKYAAKYLNKKGSGKNTCPDFEHSHGPYGENLAIGFATPRDSVSAWGDERELYNWKKPGFSSETGHFTQVVWKATKKVGCARKYCKSKNVFPGWYLVCEYSPAGNVIGQFKQNVLQNGYKPPTKKSSRSIEDAGLEERDDESEGWTGEPIGFEGDDGDLTEFLDAGDEDFDFDEDHSDE